MPPQTGTAHLVEAARDAGVDDPRVLAAMAAVPRAGYVPPEHADAAYQDAPVPIPHGQVTTQPSLSARMIQALRLRRGDRVLEVGTGYGYQTALLARLAATVVSVERRPELAETARRNLANSGVTTVEVLVGDGTDGAPEHAPFDAILVSAAYPQVPQPLVEQLRLGGRLVQPIGPGGADVVTLFERTPDGLVERERLLPAYFVRLYGRHGYA